MCICINCRHVNNCATYKIIQQQHQQKQNIQKAEISFIPVNTIIRINIDKSINPTRLDWDLVECLSFTELPGNWLIVKSNNG